MGIHGSAVLFAAAALMAEDFGSGSWWDAPSPADCDPAVGPASGNCTSIFVSTLEHTCLGSAPSTCRAASDFYTTTAKVCQGTCFPWGMVLSLVGDVVISCGLALQKVAHNRIEATKKALVEASGGKLEDVKGPSFTSMPVWWAGILMTVGGEVGNFAAYGDANTPASVVTAVG